MGLRILHLVNTLSPDTGGPAHVVRMLAKSYLKAGTHVEVVTLDDPSAPFLRDFPCRVYPLGQSYLGRYALSPRLVRWLLAHARHYDAIVMNGIWTFPGFSLFCVTRLTGTPYGVFVHGALDPWFNRQYPLKHLKKILYWPVQYSVLRNAMTVFFTTQTEQDLAKTSFWPNTWNSMVIPYGIHDPEKDHIDSRFQTEAFYSKYPHLRGRRFLLFLGRIHEKKGCDLLIEGFASNSGCALDCDLVIAGPDQVGMRAKLEKRAAQLGIATRVHWTGMIEGELKWGAVRACDAFVLPSHQENFGISVVEALAVGRPVLISNQVNIWRHIVEDCVGLVEDDTQMGTSTLLRRWFELQSRERDEMAARARCCFLSRFNIDRAVATINKVFGSDDTEVKRESA
jgi:glycosyltransferase involved in cell wall biosynthesis